MDKGEYIHMEFCMVPKKIAIATPNSVGESHYRMEKEYKRIYSVWLHSYDVQSRLNVSRWKYRW